MRTSIQLTRRNLMVFFRDRASVFFSVMALLIIIGLYVLFLGDMMVSGMKGELGADTRFIMDSWIMAGMISVASVTTTMGAYGTMVDDRRKRIAKDFSCTPVRRTSITSGYMISSFLIGVIMCLLNILLAEVYIVASGGRLMSLYQMAQMLGAMLLAVFANSAIILFLTSMFTSANAFASASTVIGTMIGFLTGIYIPIGSLPGAVQWVIRCFPPSHAAALMRQIMMGGTLDSALTGAPAGIVTDLRLMLGVNFVFGSHITTALDSVLVLVGTGLLFYTLALWQLSRKRVG